MLTLETLRAQAANVPWTELKRPTICAEAVERMAVYRKAGLGSHQVTGNSFAHRCAQVESQGFPRITLKQAAVALIGRECHIMTYRVNDWRMGRPDWYIDHENGEEAIPSSREFFSAFLRPRYRLGPKLQLGRVSMLKGKVPYGVALQMKEAREKKLFNQVVAIAPHKMFEKPVSVDPIMLGVIHAVSVDGLNMLDSENTAFFFLAQW